MKKFSDLYEKKVDIAQRKKQARRMARLAKSSAFQRKKQRSLLKPRDTAKLTVVARKKTIQKFRDKFYPDYESMAMSQKVKVDQLLQQKYGKKIDAISKKMVTKLKSAEKERVAQARKAFQDG